MLRIPSVGSFLPDCCAWTARGEARRPPATTPMNARRVATGSLHRRKRRDDRIVKPRPFTALPPAPFRLALLHECLGALDTVFRGAEERGEIVLEADAVGQGKPESAHHGFLGVAESDGRLVGDLARQSLRGGHE